MKKEFRKKVIFGILTVLMIFSTLFSFPQKANALFGVGDVVFDPTNTVQNTISASNSTVSAFSQYSLQLKAFVLDTLATTLAKTLIRQITASVVNWINSGFEGSPAFLTNPGSFFLDVADQVSGAFLAQYGGPLTALCSPFSIDIRLKLAFKYHPQIQKKYACTLGTIIKNSVTAGNNATINGASISGFMNGDFSQGGLPAFVSLTMEPQNNPYGAYLEADSELGIRVANAQLQKRDEISAGKGFLSWRSSSCMKQVAQAQKYQKDAAADPGSESPNGAEANAAIANSGGDLSESGPTTTADCPIETPGSLIVSNLETSVNGPLHELELVDSINQIVNALAAQLVNTVLQGGLRAISGSGPSDSSSYLNRIQAESNAANNAQLNTTRNSFISNVEKYITDTFKYKTNKDQSLNLILDAKKSYDDVKSCYSVKAINYPQNEPEAQSRINQIDSIENTSVAPLATTLLRGATEADNRYKTLTDIRDQANAAKTTNDLNTPSQVFSQMLQTQNLTSAKDIVDSQQELDQTQATVAPMKQDAQRKMQECQIFPNGFSTAPRN